jgi:hypothetical protein
MQCPVSGVQASIVNTHVVVTDPAGALPTRHYGTLKQKDIKAIALMSPPQVLQINMPTLQISYILDHILVACLFFT